MIAVVQSAIQAQFVGLAVVHTVGADAAFRAVLPVAFGVAIGTLGAVQTGINSAGFTDILAHLFGTALAECSAVLTQQTFLTP